MGTHPIFESDFDCLTEMGDAAPEQEPQDPNALPQGPQGQNVDALFTAHVSVLNFFAANGWYIVFAFVIFSLLWKNLEGRLEALRRSWQDAQIKRTPTCTTKRRKGEWRDWLKFKCSTTRLLWFEKSARQRSPPRAKNVTKRR